jgi:hypothetical protein
MDTERYDEVCARLLGEAQALELAKRPSYTIGSPDVLANFKRVAERTGLRPGQVLMVYALKHLDAVTSALVDPTIPQGEARLGRFADAINYLKLGYALLEEQDEPRFGRRPDD